MIYNQHKNKYNKQMLAMKLLQTSKKQILLRQPPNRIHYPTYRQLFQHQKKSKKKQDNNKDDDDDNYLKKIIAKQQKQKINIFVDKNKFKQSNLEGQEQHHQDILFNQEEFSVVYKYLQPKSKSNWNQSNNNKSYKQHKFIQNNQQIRNKAIKFKKNYNQHHQIKTNDTNQQPYLSVKSLENVKNASQDLIQKSSVKKPKNRSMSSFIIRPHINLQTHHVFYDFIKQRAWNQFKAKILSNKQVLGMYETNTFMRNSKNIVNRQKLFKNPQSEELFIRHLQSYRKNKTK